MTNEPQGCLAWAIAVMGALIVLLGASPSQPLRDTAPAGGLNDVLALLSGAADTASMTETPARLTTAIVVAPDTDAYTDADLDATADILRVGLAIAGERDAVVAVGDGVIDIRGGDGVIEALGLLLGGGVLTFEGVIGLEDVVPEAVFAQDDGFGWRIDLRLNAADGALLQAFTRANLGTQLRLLLDDEVLIDAQIQAAVGADLVISGGFDETEARMLAARIAGAALPLPLRIESLDAIDPAAP